MPLTLMYITNDPEIALIAERSGVDWIFVDLEVIGKEKRQGHLDTVISHHQISDISKIKQILSKSKLLVRSNPIHPGIEKEINQIVGQGADIIMHPYFQTAEEVRIFLDTVNGRVKTCLLVETAKAVENIDDILSLPGIDYIHIGLNDLHLEYKMKFMFELLTDGTVEKLCAKFKEKGITYGFGGVAQLGQGTLPAENIIAEHYRLGSSMVILSRSFCDIQKECNLENVKFIFHKGVKEIRNYEESFLSFSNAEFFKNLDLIKDKINEICFNLNN